MKLSFILSNDHASGVDEIRSWLDFNNFRYKTREFWNQVKMSFDIDSGIKRSIIVLNHNVFVNLFDSNQAYEKFQQLLYQENYIWVVGMDLALSLLTDQNKAKIENLDRILPKDRVTLFLDAHPLERCYLSKLSNFRTQIIPYNFFFKHAPRLQSKKIAKNSTAIDYLLTMIDKPGRPHRQLLWNELKSRTDLVSRGMISVRKPHDPGWMGQTNRFNDWKDGHASMDLYLECYWEIVPETCHDHLQFFTEKTFKPIMAQTPFIIVAAPGYLDYLKSLGFKTFTGIIDESYDQCQDLETRVKLAVVEIENICRQGSNHTYEHSKEILQYNFQRLCTIVGGWQHEFDRLIWSVVDECNQNV